MALCIMHRAFFMEKYLIVGLGNIGNEYAHTRHNIGFDILNFFVQKHKSNFSMDSSLLGFDALRATVR